MSPETLAAQYAMALEVMGQLVGHESESQVVEEIVGLFEELFAATRLTWLEFRNGNAALRQCSPGPRSVSSSADSLLRWVDTLPTRQDGGITDKGFWVRLRAKSETVGLLVVEEIEPPYAASSYLNTALGLAGVCALAVSNARAKESLRNAEERLKAEQARLRQREAELAHVARVSTVSEMGSILGHELNQPLTAILSYAEGARRRFQSDTDADALLGAIEHIARLAKRAAQIVKGIRQLVKKRVGQEQKVDVNEVVSEAILLTIAEARHKGVTVTSDLIRKPAIVDGRFVLLEQVILNLLRNSLDALEATKEGARELTVRTLRAEDGEGIEVIVEDSGVGIRPDVADQMFDAFFTTKIDGLGLGLSISRTIVEAHGGRLQATPRKGKGTTFHLWLPLADNLAIP